MRTATIERQLKNGDKIKLSLILDSNRQINEFDELETVCKKHKRYVRQCIEKSFSRRFRKHYKVDNRYGKLIVSLHCRNNYTTNHLNKRS